MLPPPERMIFLILAKVIPENGYCESDVDFKPLIGCGAEFGNVQL
jgi:hypothetical protein